MEWVLTGANFSAQEAMSAGLVSRVFPDDVLIEEAIKTATVIV